MRFIASKIHYQTEKAVLAHITDPTSHRDASCMSAFFFFNIIFHTPHVDIGPHIHTRGKSYHLSF
jgi:hypothetical protein